MIDPLVTSYVLDATARLDGLSLLDLEGAEPDQLAALQKSAASLIAEISRHRGKEAPDAAREEPDRSEWPFVDVTAQIEIPPGTSRREVAEDVASCLRQHLDASGTWNVRGTWHE